ncbi:MAG: hypothetical protein Q8936_18015 [Bacillota bacterium]|nr:hypothetical protein [Bacillota bacterium]
MQYKSHIDKEKFSKLAKGQPFQYRDVVADDFPASQHTMDGVLFKKEVESGVFTGAEVADEDETHIIYRKL